MTWRSRWLTPSASSRSTCEGTETPAARRGTSTASTRWWRTCTSWRCGSPSTGATGAAPSRGRGCCAARGWAGPSPSLTRRATPAAWRASCSGTTTPTCRPRGSASRRTRRATSAGRSRSLLCWRSSSACSATQSTSPSPSPTGASTSTRRTRRRAAASRWTRTSSCPIGRPDSRGRSCAPSRRRCGSSSSTTSLPSTGPTSGRSRCGRRSSSRPRAASPPACSSSSRRAAPCSTRRRTWSKTCKSCTAASRRTCAPLRPTSTAPRETSFVRRAPCGTSGSPRRSSRPSRRRRRRSGRRRARRRASWPRRTRRRPPLTSSTTRCPSPPSQHLAGARLLPPSRLAWRASMRCSWATARAARGSLGAVSTRVSACHSRRRDRTQKCETHTLTHSHTHHPHRNDIRVLIHRHRFSSRI
mmetsp:Transcript_22732/g.69185  ORF Transcript_22732/g.69185 Transcript_22732/m.69185 type:complete len:415 (+) Transcript_22732:585-1829(+)